MMCEYKHQQIGTVIITAETADMITKRMNAAFKQTSEALNASLFSGVPIPATPLTWRDDVRRRLDRVRDAWLVLTGKADIDW